MDQAQFETPERRLDAKKSTLKSNCAFWTRITRIFTPSRHRSDASAARRTIRPRHSTHSRALWGLHLIVLSIPISVEA
jgi:hypothetical protein